MEDHNVCLQAGLVGLNIKIKFSTRLEGLKIGRCIQIVNGEREGSRQLGGGGSEAGVSLQHLHPVHQYQMSVMEKDQKPRMISIYLGNFLGLEAWSVIQEDM